MSIKNKYLVKPIDSFLCKEWLLKKHYLKRWVSFTYSFGLFENNFLVGVLTFGNAIPLTMKKSLFGEKYMHLVYELNRLCTNDNLDKNANSYFISQAFKLLPKPFIIVSYADKSVGHNGYIYQATNFIFTGESHTQLDWKLKGSEHLHSRTLMDEFPFQKDRIKKLKEKYKDNLYQVKREPKYRYVYVLADKKKRKEIMNNKKFNIQTYPKGDNIRYDATYKPIIQTQLF
ncbi:MAG: hypothetical protein EBV32_05160 [Proteobacteria bacterium]|uniref:Protein Mom n=1 Tax=Candidatus Fonsibacter lacus TaxID=2576439 RepID=A0A964XS95_9PROT|nr:hypothetical protein [Candidatus Fonsibacter lacus]NBP60151.1 hypothetical protein [Pseudomonadota bacterium]NCU72178.1 hypothetical protein [Candidatus Fonsibacter lacus]